MRCYQLVFIVVAISVAVFSSKLASAQAVLSPDKAAKAVVVRNVKVENGAVSGELVNKSAHALRNVQLLIRHVWHWKNELRPGKDAPGLADFYTVTKEIALGGTISFTYKPTSPLPRRADGYFETTVSVAGYTEVIR